MKNMMLKNMNNGAMGAVDVENADNFVKALEGLGYKVKLFEAGKVPFEELPPLVKAEVLDTLKAFSSVHVEYEDMKFHVTTVTMLSSEYAFDHCVCGTYLAKDLYTAEERRANFKEVFGYEPYGI